VQGKFQWTKQRGALRSLRITKYYSGDQVKEKVVGGAYNMFVGEERCVRGFGGET
jgi:hypothetical protein